MPGPTFLEGDGVTLRTIEREDLPFCQRNLNDPRVRRGIDALGPTTADEEEEWYDAGEYVDVYHYGLLEDEWRE